MAHDTMVTGRACRPVVRSFVPRWNREPTVLRKNQMRSSQNVFPAVDWGVFVLGLLGRPLPGALSNARRPWWVRGTVPVTDAPSRGNVV